MTGIPTFQSRGAQRLWADFTSRLAWTFRDMPKDERTEAIREAHIHVLDAFAETDGVDERGRLQQAIERFGPLEARPSPWRPVAATALQYAAILVIGTLGFLTLLLLAMIATEVFNPAEVGLWVYPSGDWSLSFNAQTGANEVLNAWFIPATLAVCTIQIGIIYLLHRFALAQNGPLATWRNTVADAAS